jgi:O-antigen ligase
MGKEGMVKKLKVILLYTITFTLPFNIRYVFNFAEIQNIEGFREHLAMSLYFFDFLFVPLLIISIWDNRKDIFTKKFLEEIFNQPLIYLGIFILLSPLILGSFSSGVAWYKVARLLELLILFTIVRNILRQYTVLTYFKFILFASGVVQSIIALLQFITQKSIGLSWLGESVIGPNILGVAKFSFEGEKFIRAYGTFPHPNVLGIFLLFSLSAGLSLMLAKKNLLLGLRWRYRLIFFGELLLVYVGLLLTYSRSIILLTAIISLIFAYAQRKFINQTYKNLCKQLHIPFFLQTSLAIIVVFTTLFASYNLLAPRLCLYCPGDEAISLRGTYQETANSIIFKNMSVGIGLGNFIPISKRLSPELAPWDLQPVHNLYLLVASELGLIGLLLFLVTIFFYAARNLRLRLLTRHPLDLFFMLVLLAGFFDHYFWTLHQGQLIFWIALALVSVSKTTKIDSPKYHFKPVLKNIRQFIKELS